MDISDENEMLKDCQQKRFRRKRAEKTKVKTIVWKLRINLKNSLKKEKMEEIFWKKELLDGKEKFKIWDWKENVKWWRITSWAKLDQERKNFFSVNFILEPKKGAEIFSREKNILSNLKPKSTSKKLFQA